MVIVFSQYLGDHGFRSCFEVWIFLFSFPSDKQKFHLFSLIRFSSFQPKWTALYLHSAAGETLHNPCSSVAAHHQWFIFPGSCRWTPSTPGVWGPRQSHARHSVCNQSSDCRTPGSFERHVPAYVTEMSLYVYYDWFDYGVQVGPPYHWKICYRKKVFSAWL